MNRILFLVAALALVGCGPRKVDVRTAPVDPGAASGAPSIEVTNTLAQAYNVYVVLGSTNTFLKQVAANSTTRLPVTTYSAGTTVALRAVSADGATTYSRQGVVLNGVYAFHLP